MLENNFQKAFAVLRVVDRAGQQGFGKTLDRRERSFEFVRNIGDEIAAHPFESAQFA